MQVILKLDLKGRLLFSLLLCNRIIVPRTIVTRFDYTCSFPLSSEAALVAQLQTPIIKPPVILFSGLLTQGAQVSEIN